MKRKREESAAVAVRKALLRRQLRALRAAIPRADRRRAAHRAARAALRALRRCRHVALYFSHGSELDTAPLLRALAARRHCLYLPRLRGERLVFVQFRRGAALRRNRFGIPEPRGAARGARLDAVVMPLVGFDGAGRRLGQGGGFYDRAVARQRALRLGFAFAVQEVPAVPAEPHDARLHAVVTERGLRRFRP